MTTNPDQKLSAAPLCHIVSSVGMLGYGIDAAKTDAALERFTATGVPTAMILDSGSTDSGPQKLALGGMTVPKSSYVRDLRKLLASTCRYQVPLIFSSAGGSGTDHNTRELAEVIKELASEIGTGGRELKVVCLFSDIPKGLVKERLRNGAITGCGIVVPRLEESDVDACPVIVAQMGYEPFLDALNDHSDLHVLVGGRAYDPSPFVAFAEFCYQKQCSGSSNGIPSDNSSLIGGFTHMGKILECAGLCAIPKGGGALSTVYVDGSFDIVPMTDAAKCTPLSVAAHTLYEKSRPDRLYGPGGYLDLTRAEYTQLGDGRTVRVRGGRFHWSVADADVGRYQVKLEGAKAVGYRSMYVGAIKDPILLGQLDEFLDDVRDFVAGQHEDVSESWDLKWHVYGREGCAPPTEVCIVGEALAESQELATSIAATAKVGTIHNPYKRQKATSGNLAHGIGGLYTVPLGPCAEFCVYHLMDLTEGEERGGSSAALFRTETITIPCQEGQTKNKIQSAEPAAEEKKKKVAAKKAYTNGEKTVNPLLRPGASVILGDIAQVIRSKNSGPYEITFDIIFDRKDVFQFVKDANILNVQTVAGLYGIQPEQVVWSGFFDQALAFKATIPRIRQGVTAVAGGYMEDDVHGSQMYLPLLTMPVPQDLVVQLRSIV